MHSLSIFLWLLSRHMITRVIKTSKHVGDSISSSLDHHTVQGPCISGHHVLESLEREEGKETVNLLLKTFHFRNKVAKNPLQIVFINYSMALDRSTSQYVTAQLMAPWHTSSRSREPKRGKRSVRLTDLMLPPPGRRKSKTQLLEVVSERECAVYPDQ